MLTTSRSITASIAVMFASLAEPLFAASIMTSASGAIDGDSYSYLFTIEDDVDPLVFHAELTNTSPSDGDPLIDLLAFNILGSPVLGVDFDIVNITPNWTFSEASGGVQFDYLGQPASPFERLLRFESLTFDIVFNDGTASLDLFLDAPATLGTGIGGGSEEGQVAVSFQQLGAGGEGSDLLTSNWGPGIAETAEPSVLAALATGLLGIASLLRRRP